MFKDDVEDDILLVARHSRRGWEPHRDGPDKSKLGLVDQSIEFTNVTTIL